MRINEFEITMQEFSYDKRQLQAYRGSRYEGTRSLHTLSGVKLKVIAGV